MQHLGVDDFLKHFSASTAITHIAVLPIVSGCVVTRLQRRCAGATRRPGGSVTRADEHVDEDTRSQPGMPPVTPTGERHEE
jgi:hypothetical protein